MIHPIECLSDSELGLGDKPGEGPEITTGLFSIQGKAFKLE